MNKKGFTLIEIIIVVIIIGVLATIALPRITSQLTSSKSAEALHMLGSIRRAAMNCADLASADGTNCVTWTTLSMSAPTNSMFTYTSVYSSPNMIFNADLASSGGADMICVSINQITGAATFDYKGTTFTNIVKKVTSTAAGTTCQTRNAM